MRESLLIWDSSVGIATRYGLEGPGIESLLRRDFPHPSRPALGPTQPPAQWVPDLSWGKAAGTWRWPPIPFYRWSWRKSRAIRLLPLWAFVACYRVNLTVTFYTPCPKKIVPFFLFIYQGPKEKLLKKVQSFSDILYTKCLEEPHECVLHFTTEEKVHVHICLEMSDFLVELKGCSQQ